MATTCTFDPADTLRYPYEFKNASGETVTVPISEGVTVVLDDDTRCEGVFATFDAGDGGLEERARGDETDHFVSVDHQDGGYRAREAGGRILRDAGK